MKIAFAGDFHIHNFGPFAQPWREGINTRARDIYEIVGEWLPNKLKELKVDAFAFLGDANMNASNDYRMVNFTKQALSACEFSAYRTVAIHGNHDTVSDDRDNHNGFPYFEKAAWGPIVEMGEVTFMLIGYNTPLPDVKKLGKWRNKAVIFCLHKDIEGGMASNGFIYRTKNAVSIKNLFEIKKALPGAMFFAGHYHHRQAISLVNIVGAPVQHNRGDEGSVRGFSVLDTKTNKILLLPSPCYRFVTKDVHEIDELKDLSKTYLTINVQAGNAKEYKLAMDIKDNSPNVAIKEIAKTKQTKTNSEDVSLMSDPELMSKWLDINYSELSKKERSEIEKMADAL